MIRTENSVLKCTPVHAVSAISYLCTECPVEGHSVLIDMSAVTCHNYPTKNDKQMETLLSVTTCSPCLQTSGYINLQLTLGQF